MFSRLLSLLKRFVIRSVRAVFSYLFLSLALCVSICLLVWFFGPRIHIAGYSPLASVEARFITILVVIFLWGLNNLVFGWYRRRKLQKAEEKKEESPPRDPMQERLDAFEKSFRQAMNMIKDNWIGARGPRRGKRSLYALPWYVVLGLPAAGKTSLIVESDLKFPLAHLFSQEDFKHVNPTEDIDYWVTDEAVLFDVAGQVLTHSKTSPKDDIIDISALIWRKFLSLLGEYRPRRPINGAVLCLDVVDLIKADPEVRSNMAALMHARLVELSESLGTRYTVHVVLTKFDLLDGFHEFLTAFNQSQRQEPFGFAFDFYREADANAWIGEFEKEFDAFLERTNNMLLDRIIEQRATAARRRFYTFTRQLAGLKKVLIEFLGQALHQDKFSTAPQIRGVFMSSSRQEAAPFNAVLAAASHKYEITAPILPVHNGYSKQFFSKNLFKSVIFKEAGLAGDNIRIERSKRIAFAGSVLAGCVLFVGFASFYWLAYDDNRRRAGQVVDIARAASYTGSSALQESAYSAGLTYVEPLNALRSASAVFGDYRSKTQLGSFLTLHQGLKIGPQVERIYASMLEQNYLPEVAAYVRERIGDLGRNSGTRASDERLETLRVYLMLGDASRRNNTFVEAWMRENWQQLYEGKTDLQKSLAEHLRFAVGPAELEARLNEPLVLQAQADLREVPRDLRLYRNIEQIAARQLLNAVNLRNDIGPAYNIIFTAGDETALRPEPIIIRPFFTRAAFHDFFIKQNDKLSVIAVEDAWVAGERDTVAYSPEDLEAFRRKVIGRYTAHYTETWVEALNRLEITDFKNLDHAVEVLEAMTGPETPFTRLLERVRSETSIYEAETIELEPQEAVDADLPFDLNREHGLRIRRAFSRLNAVIEAEEGEKAYLEDLQIALDRLYEHLKEIQQAGDRAGEVALAKAKDRINLKGDDPIYVIRRLSVDLPEPLNRFFDKIADQSWKVILQKSKEELQRSWNEEVYAEYNLNLATRYPFAMGAQQEAPLKEFEAFFGPGGKIETFYENNLALFVDEATKEPRIIDGRHLAIEPEFLVQLNKALELRAYYFRNEDALGVEYAVQPANLSGNSRRAVMNIEGQILSYSHGPKRPVRIVWPNILAKEAESKLTIFPSGQGRPKVLSFKGPWSVFRLLDHGVITGYAGDEVEIEFNLNGVRASYLIRQTGQSSPAGQSPLTGLALPARM